MCVALPVLLSCDRKEDDVVAAPRMLFSAEEIGTKSFINDVNRSGNQIVVFDYMKTPGTNAYEWYIDHRRIFCEVDGQQVWDFVQGDEYYWLDDSIHNCFGWLYMGPSGNTTQSFFETHPDIDKSTFKLSIPAKTFHLDTPIYDFLYSDVERREFDKTDPDTSPVKLKMSHLFTAFRFRVKNMRKAEINITGASLTMTTRKSATIDFSKATDPSQSVTVNYTAYGEPSTIGYEQDGVKDDVVLSSGSEYVNLLHPVDPEGYHISWPQFATDISLSSFTIKGTKNINIPLTGTNMPTEWHAGKMYSYDIVFTDKEVLLTCNVDPWTRRDINLEFSEIVVVSDKMQWHRSTVESVNEHTGEVVLFNNATSVTDHATAAECWFKIASPAGARWQASLIGNSEAFEFVDPETDEVIASPQGDVGKLAQLKIRAVYNEGITDTKKAVLRIVILPIEQGGQSIVVENLGSGHDFHEYTLVRNATSN